MKMKRLLAGICCAAMALGAFTGCQSTGGNDGYNVAIVQLVDTAPLPKCGMPLFRKCGIWATVKTK